MKEKIIDHEIVEVLNETPRELIPLTEIVIKLGRNRKNKNKETVSKTAIYEKLTKMVEQKKIYHINRKGYKILNYEFTQADPNYRFFELYKRIINSIGFLWVTKTGKLEEQPEVMDQLFDDISEDEWNDFKDNYGKLIEQGILEFKRYYKIPGSYLSISYYWALFHNICPVCLEKIELNKPHFVLEFVEEEIAYVDFAKIHIHCIEMILDRHELKKEHESKIPKYDPYEEFNFEEISRKYVGLTCSYCGLTMDLYDLFFADNGTLEDLNKKFQTNFLHYIQNLCKELYGDISTLIWAKKISFKKVRLVIKKVVILNGKAYHPNCAFKKFEDIKRWRNISKQSKIGSENE